MPVLIELKDDRSETIHYDSPSYPIYIRRGLLSRYPNYAAPSHWHDDIELIAVLDGEMRYTVNGTVIPLRCGEGILVNSRQMHFGFSDRCTECDFLCVLLHPALLCATPLYEQNFVLPIVRSDAVPYVFLDPAVGWQNSILGHIRAIYASRGLPSTPLRVQAAFASIWALLCENLPPQSAAAPLPGSDLTITRNMVGFIQQNYAQKLTLGAIAAAGAVGQSKCCKLFAQYFGQTPNVYLTRYRLNKSLPLLRRTDLPITEIALSVGFGSASYYAETFRRYFGKSPTEYRREEA